MESHRQEEPLRTGPNNQKQLQHVYEFGDFRLDTQNTTSHRLLLNGQPLRIQNKQFCLLCILVENHERQLSNDELIGHVWNDEVVDDTNWDDFVGRLHSQLRMLRTLIG